MNRIVKAQIALEERRAALGKLLDIPAETRSETWETDMEAAKAAITAAQAEYQAAAMAEPETPEIRQNTAEGREMRSLLARASLADFVRESEGVPLSGASLECRNAILGADHVGFVPLELFGLEQRVDAVTSVDAIQNNQQAIQPRVFNIPAAEYLGCSFPVVPVGTASFPRLSGGTSADVRSEGVELDGTAATIANEPISPVRLTASYTYGVESLANVQGFEEALRADVQSVLFEKRDSLVINGQAAVANTSPAIEGIISGLTDPANPGDVFEWDDVLDAYDAAVDGKHAMDSEAVRMLTNADLFRRARKLQVATSGQLLRELLPRERFRVSAAMPSTASNISTYLTYAAGSPTRAMLAPTWAGLQLVNDPYTRAKQGERVVTAIMIVGFQIADKTPYTRGEFKVA